MSPRFPILEVAKAFQLREPQVSYRGVFDTKNADIDAKHSCFWNTKPDISI